MIGKFFGNNKKKEAKEKKAVEDIIRRQQVQTEPSAHFMATAKKDGELHKKNDSNKLSILASQLPTAPTDKPSHKKR